MLFVLGVVLSACTSSSAVGSACMSAAGTCVIGPGVNCVKQAATGAQDCNPDLNPGGATCCVEFADASPASLADGGGRDALTDGDAATPCPAAAMSNEPGSCAEAGALCGYCYEGTGVGCECQASEAGTSGQLWLCVPTEHVCQ
jgi:hypothetical protein